MRRILAIVIVILLGLTAVSPLFALSSTSDPNLPACCRRDGKHHCMAMPGMPTVATLSKTQATTATVADRCPYGQHSLPGASHPDTTLGTAAAVYADVLSHPSVSPQTESKRRISADRSHQKRGPPASVLA